MTRTTSTAASSRVEQQRSFDRNRMRPFLNRLEDRLVAEAAAVVTVSDGIAELMERTFGRRPVVIRNCHDERLDRAACARSADSIGPDVGRIGSASSSAIAKPGMAVAVRRSTRCTMLPERFPSCLCRARLRRPGAEIAPASRGARVHFGRYTAPNQDRPASFARPISAW